VSPNYAHEIQQPQGGFGLHDFVRAKASSGRAVGILNGIDDAWNPQTDKKIYSNYSVESFVQGKRMNKGALQKELNLEPNPNCVLIGFTGRLTWQKGVDVLGSIIPWLMQDTGNGVTGNCQLIMMGNGERQYADVLRWAEVTYPGKVCGYVGFDPEVEHKIMAGCDLFLMPSRYEPCGLPQMCSQLYGTLPIVTDTGGLHDSVKDISAGLSVATGFHIPHLEQGKVKEVVYKAAELFFKQAADFQAMQMNAMLSDYYWTRAIDEYEKQIDVTLSDYGSFR
jgi:starch synthase